MDAPGLLLRARLRRWRGWVSLCLLAGLLSGLVLAAVSAGHRTATAFPQFVAAHGYDALVISAAPMPALTTRPDVASATVVHEFAAGTPTCACARPINPAYFNLSGVAPSGLPRMVKLVAGRMPDQNSPDEVLASFRMQQDIGVGVGTVIRVPLYSAAQQSAYLNGAAVTPAGGTVTLRVVGIEAAEAEFPFAATTSYALYTTAAFSRLWAGRTAGVAFSFVRLRGGAAAFPRFEAQARALEHDPQITDIAIGGGGGVMIDGRVVSALAGAGLRGPLPLVTAGGRLPRTTSEVALGAATLRQLGAHVGSEVRVTAQQSAGGSRTSRYLVTGTVVFAPSDGTGGLGTGAVFTLDGLLSPQCGRLPAGAAQNVCRLRTVVSVGGNVLVTAAAGPRGQADIARLARAYPAEVNLPYPPTSLVNFGEVNFPLLLGMAVAVFGAATLVHALVVSVGRRRRETGLLKVLGFVRRQTAFAMSWQTTTVAVAGLIVGLPLGIAAGRLGWDLFAGYIGFVPVPIVLAWGLVALAAGTIAVANLIALGPAVAAARIRPAAALRAE